MKDAPTVCPFCEGELVVEEFVCRQCDTHFRGRWQLGVQLDVDSAKLPILERFSRLQAEQLNLLESFILCDGKLNRLQAEVGLSYPTLRSRLNDIIEALGGKVSSDNDDAPSRRSPLERLQPNRLLNF